MKVLEKLHLLFIKREVDVEEQEVIQRQKEIKIKAPPNTHGYIDIAKIIVPKRMLNSYPNPDKVATYTNRCKELGYLDKPLTIAMDNSYPNSNSIVLRDGYIRYLIASQAGMKLVPVRWEL